MFALFKPCNLINQSCQRTDARTAHYVYPVTQASDTQPLGAAADIQGNLSTESTEGIGNDACTLTQ